MGKKKYTPTTTKHPMEINWEGTKRATVELGGGDKLQVEPGMPAKSSEPYEGQAGKSMLFLPQGNKSKFVLSPETIDRFFDRVRGGTEERNRTVRDYRGKSKQVSTGGRRQADEINPKLAKIKNKDTGQNMNAPQNIAAGDQYDDQNFQAIFEEISNLDDQGFDQFLNSLEEQQIENFVDMVCEAMKKGARVVTSKQLARMKQMYPKTFQARMLMGKGVQLWNVAGGRKGGKSAVPNYERLMAKQQNPELHKNIVARKRQRRDEDAVLARNVQSAQHMADKFNRSAAKFKGTRAQSKIAAAEKKLGRRLTSDETAKMVADEPDVTKTPEQMSAELDIPTTRAALRAQNRAIREKERRGEGTDTGAVRVRGADGELRYIPGKVARGHGTRLAQLGGSTERAAERRFEPGGDESQNAARENISGVVRSDEPEEKKPSTGPGMQARAAAATSGVPVSKTYGRKVRSRRGLGIEEGVEIMENYIDAIANKDVINFSDMVRMSLDAHAHGAIENMKQEFLDQQDEYQMSEQDSAVLESLEQYSEQQLDELFESLDDQQVEYIHSLVEAKYGTAAGRKRLAKKIQAGEDIGKKGKGFEKVAKKAAEQYGSKEAGERVAAAAMWKRYGGKRKK